MQRAWVIAALLAAACAAPSITPKVKAANSQYLYSISEDKEPELALLDDEAKNVDTLSIATEPFKFDILDHTFNEIRGSTALPPLEDEIDFTITTDSSAIESITYNTNTIKQGIDDNKTNLVTNPSNIWKYSNENGSESNYFAETTSKSKRQRGHVTYDTENTVTSQYKFDYDNSDPDTSSTKYDARPNNISTLKTTNFNEDNQGEVSEDVHVHLYLEHGQNEDEARRTSKNIETNNSDKDNHNEGNTDEDFRPYWERDETKNRKPKYSDQDYENKGDEDNSDIFPSRNHNSDKDNHNEGNTDENFRPYWERDETKNRKPKYSDKDYENKGDEDNSDIFPSRNHNSDKNNHNEGNTDEDVRPYWETDTTKNRKTKYFDKDYENKDFPSRNHIYYNPFDYNREDDRKYNYEPRIDRHHNKGIWNHFKGIWNNLEGIWKSSDDKYRRRERYPNSYDSYRSRSKYRRGRKHYGYKDSEDCSYNSPDRKRYDDYHRHRDDKTRSHSHYGDSDRKRYRDNNWHEGRRYYNKERNSGRKYYKDYYRNDEYNRDDKHYGKFARHNGHSKSYSRYQDF